MVIDEPILIMQEQWESLCKTRMQLVANLLTARERIRALEAENKRLNRCRQELIDVTNACRDERVNLTHTLEECISEVYDRAEAKMEAYELRAGATYCVQCDQYLSKDQREGLRASLDKQSGYSNIRFVILDGGMKLAQVACS